MKDDWLDDELDDFDQMLSPKSEAKEAILTHIDQIVREVIGEEEPILLDYAYEPAHIRNQLRQEQLKRREAMK